MKRIFILAFSFLFLLFSCQKHQEETPKKKFLSLPSRLEVQVFNPQGENITLQVQGLIRMTEISGEEVKKIVEANRFYFEFPTPEFVEKSKHNAAMTLEKATKKQILLLGEQKKEIFCEISYIERYVKGGIFADGVPIFHPVTRVEIEKIVFPRTPKDEYLMAVLELIYENGKFSIKE